MAILTSSLAWLFLPLRLNSKSNAVYLWSHDTYHIDQLLAVSLDDFAFGNAVATAHEAQRLSGAAWRKLSGRERVGWALSSGLEFAMEDGSGEEECADRSDFENDLDPDNWVLGFFWRGEWIGQPLARDEERDWEFVRATFRPGWNPVLVDNAKYEEHVEWGDTIAPHAIYLLWRLFWFKLNQRLGECCKRYRNHPARMVRLKTCAMPFDQSWPTTPTPAMRRA